MPIIARRVNDFAESTALPLVGDMPCSFRLIN